MEAGTDAFALLGLAPAAALTADAVRQAFTVAAAAAHPDQALDEADRAERTAGFSLLNEACALLSNPSTRLRHLAERLYPGRPLTQSTGPDEEMIRLFTTAGAAVNAADVVRQRMEKAGSALGRALLAPALMQAQEGLEAVAADLDSQQSALYVLLEEIDAGILQGAEVREQITAAAARAVFLHKWQQQIRNANASLAMLG